MGDFGGFGVKITTAELAVNMLRLALGVHLFFVLVEFPPSYEDFLARLTPEPVAGEGARPRFIFGDFNG
jgi:hypothetical protein